VSWYLAVLKNYAGFGGRACRKEYWMFILFNLIVVVAVLVMSVAAEVLLQIGTVAKATVPYMIYLAATFVPALAVAVRRLHDTGRSGWWMLISAIPVVGGITLLVFLVSEGAAGENRYGPNPKRAPARV
jgi:uncharacterized membrane protein YhaH (DUF805 family)